VTVPMSLNPDQVKALRGRDAAKVSRNLQDAAKAVKALEQAVLLWSDSVRAAAEEVHGGDADDEVLWAVPEYSASLDAIREVQAARDRLADATTKFDNAEGRQAQ
jgi:hypothetical protein